MSALSVKLCSRQNYTAGIREREYLTIKLGDVRQRDLTSIRQVEERILLRRVQVVAVPPAAAQRVEQRRGVGKAAGLRLDAREQRLKVRLLRIEHQDVIDVTEF